MREEIISVEGLRKTYSTGLVTFEALKGVDFKVYQGEFVAIMGNSGSGKSTLMNIIGCLDVATSGKYFLGGQDISLCKENQLNVVRCEKIGFVFQSFNLLPKLSVLQNVELPMVYRGKKAHERKVKAIELLEMVGFGDKLKNLLMQRGESNGSIDLNFPMSSGEEIKPFVLMYEVKEDRFLAIKKYSHSHNVTINDITLAAFYRVLYQILNKQLS